MKIWRLHKISAPLSNAHDGCPHHPVDGGSVDGTDGAERESPDLHSAITIDGGDVCRMCDHAPRAHDGYRLCSVRCPSDAGSGGTVSNGIRSVPTRQRANRARLLDRRERGSGRYSCRYVRDDPHRSVSASHGGDIFGADTDESTLRRGIVTREELQ